MESRASNVVPVILFTGFRNLQNLACSTTVLMTAFSIFQKTKDMKLKLQKCLSLKPLVRFLQNRFVRLH